MSATEFAKRARRTPGAKSSAMTRVNLANVLERWRPRIDDWARQWGVAGLESRLALQVSPRMFRSLGRCAPHKLELRVAAFLLDGPTELLDEVLCHEAAHAAVFELHGSAPKPHGQEWRALMDAAGFPARLRIPVPGELGARRKQEGRATWAHRCPVCHATRLAGRPVRQWRCAVCREAGLSGELEIRRATTLPMRRG